MRVHLYLHKTHVCQKYVLVSLYVLVSIYLACRLLPEDWPVTLSPTTSPPPTAAPGPRSHLASPGTGLTRTHCVHAQLHTFQGPSPVPTQCPSRPGKFHQTPVPRPAPAPRSLLPQHRDPSKHPDGWPVLWPHSSDRRSRDAHDQLLVLGTKAATKCVSAIRTGETADVTAPPRCSGIDAPPPGPRAAHRRTARPEPRRKPIGLEGPAADKGVTKAGSRGAACAVHTAPHPGCAPSFR